MSWRLVIVLCCLTLPLWGAEKNLRYQVDPKASHVQFSAKAPLETVIGKTQQVTGEVTLAGGRLSGAKASFVVDVASIKTGNRLRDKDMRKKFMETDQYPQIRFSLDKILSGAFQILPGKPVELTVAGTWEMHGVARTEIFPVTVQVEGANKQMTLHSVFTLRLSDYQIERPQFLWMRLSETADVTVYLVLHP